MRLIDADALQKAHEKLCDGERNFCQWSGSYNEWRCGLIDEQPTIDSFRHSHWIHSTAYDSCFLCGHRVYDGVYSTRHTTPYCEMCGAKMDKEAVNVNEAH